MSEEELRRRRAAWERIRRRKRRRTIRMVQRLALCVGVVALVLVLGIVISHVRRSGGKEASTEEAYQKKIVEAPDFDVQLLTPNPYSRPQAALPRVKGLVIHYTANPGTSAQQNHDYFEGLKDSRITKASSHFIIGMEGEIIQCIPSSEIAYASNERNADTMAIECCHLDETGEFTKETYDSLVHLTAWLLGKFDITVENVIRHYDVTGKECPRYFVENQEAWEKFLLDVRAYIEKYGVQGPQVAS